MVAGALLLVVDWTVEQVVVVDLDKVVQVGCGVMEEGWCLVVNLDWLLLGFVW